MTCQPRRWLWGLVPLSLPFLAAWYLNSPVLETRLAGAAQGALGAAGIGWASIAMDGRDARLAGTAPSEAAADEAARIVAATYGVRRVDRSQVAVGPAAGVPALAAPTVDAFLGAVSPTRITGTWPEGEAEGLAVAVDGTVHRLGTDPALTSNGAGRWTLELAQPLAEGVTDVAVTVTAPDGRSSGDAGVADIVVDQTPPVPPTVAAVETETPRPEIAGTWPEGDATGLEVTVGGTVYVLGTDEALASDGQGRWTLRPTDDLGDGLHDVRATAIDAAGNRASDRSYGELRIALPLPQAPGVAPLVTSATRPILTGAWLQGAGERLSVEVGDQIYVSGADEALSTDGKTWTLVVAEPLAEGTYDVVVTASNAGGRSAVTTAEGALVVDTTPPPGPTVTATIARSPRPTVAGTWPHRDAATLSVTVAGTTYVLGKARELTVGADGAWTLALPADVPDGVHDVAAVVTDAAGNAAQDATAGELTVDTSGPSAPTVSTVMTRNRQPILTGAWPSGEAASLTVEVGGQVYRSGDSPELTVDGDAWSLAVSRPLADGTYDVVVTAADAAGNSTVDATADDLIVDATPPPPPTVTPSEGTFPRPLISGTWPAAEAESLAVTVAGQTYVLSTSDGISSNERGDWSLLLPFDLAPGAYDVAVIVADRAGNRATDATVDEIVVSPAAEDADAGAEADASDCQDAVDAVLAGEAIAFEPATTVLTAEGAGMLRRLADAIRGCPGAPVEIVGEGTMGEARARTVRDGLIDLGLGVDRVGVRGADATAPADGDRPIELRVGE